MVLKFIDSQKIIGHYCTYYKVKFNQAFIKERVFICFKWSQTTPSSPLTSKQNTKKKRKQWWIKIILKILGQ